MLNLRFPAISSPLLLALSGGGLTGDVLDGVIGLGANQENQAGDVNPQHQDDEGGEGAVQPRKVIEMSEIEAESGGRDDKGDGGEDPARSQPCPPALHIGKAIIDEIEAETHQEERGDPAGDLEGKWANRASVGPNQIDRPASERENREGKDQKNGGNGCAEQSDDSFLPEAASFLGAVSGRERFHQADDAGRCGPEGSEDAYGQESLITVREVEDGGEDYAPGSGREIVGDPLSEAVPESGGRQPADNSGHDEKKRKERKDEIEGHDSGEIDAMVGLNVGPDGSYKDEIEAGREPASLVKSQRAPCGLQTESVERISVLEQPVHGRSWQRSAARRPLAIATTIFSETVPRRISAECCRGDERRQFGEP